MANNSKIMTIIRHEYLTKVKSKGFIISTILGPLIILAFLGISVASSVLTQNSTEKKIAVLDRTNLKLDQKIILRDKDRFELPTTKSEDELQQQVLNEKIDGYLIIPDDFLQSAKVTVYTRGGGGIGFITLMEKHLNNIIRKERLIQNGTDTSVINMIDVSVDIGTKKITAKGTEKDYTEAYAGIGYILGFFIYIMMMLYGSLVMRSVIEEKANRIIEVIASSARPFEIMMGKVIGIGLVGMTQVTFWLVVGGILLASAGPIMMMFMPKPEVLAGGMQMAQVPQLPIDIPRIPISLILGFIFYFIAGYFIYSTLFAAVGSAVDQESDAAQLQTPVMLPIILPMMFMPAIMANPDGPLAVILSLIPFFTPILMIVRVAATNVPFWQIALSVVLLIGTFFGALWATSKIYRVGILMYGKKPKLSDLIKWIKLAK